MSLAPCCLVPTFTFTPIIAILPLMTSRHRIMSCIGTTKLRSFCPAYIISKKPQNILAKNLSCFFVSVPCLSSCKGTKMTKKGSLLIAKTLVVLTTMTFTLFLNAIGICPSFQIQHKSVEICLHVWATAARLTTPGSTSKVSRTIHL